MSVRVNCPLIMRFADFVLASISILSCACSTRDMISPMPRIRSAIRSGWNTSKSSIFSPRPTNFTGTCVMERTDRIPPPLESPSSFVNTRPVTSSCSWKLPATFTISCPVIASTVSKISSGCTKALISDSSCISSSSICRRPAVSKSTVS